MYIGTVHIESSGSTCNLIVKGSTLCRFCKIHFRGLVECTYDTCLSVNGVYNILMHSVQESNANAAVLQQKTAAALCNLRVTSDQCGMSFIQS